MLLPKESGFVRVVVVVLAVMVGVSGGASDPTLYQYYTSGGIHSGLTDVGEQFQLNGKHFVIYGGSFHYFRVVPEHWPAILARFRAAGLNTVQLYLAWNLHEDIPDHFDFESAALDLDRFLTEIKQADMFAIVRPGPYICAEWEFGGFPSWLLRDPNLRFRTNYPWYMERVKKFWRKSMSIINRHQLTVSGGPVIALQLENEYSAYIHHPASDEYLHMLFNETRSSGFRELLFQSDPVWQAQNYSIRSIFPNSSGVLQTANLNSGALGLLSKLKHSQPHRPVYVSEFWPGWFDHWGGAHAHYSVEKFNKEVGDTVFTLNGSVNFYMFIGGTNFGFMAGHKLVTSYDYDAPLTEAGNYTAKYHAAREIYQKLVSTGRLPRTHLPEVPAPPKAHGYGRLAVGHVMPLSSLLAHASRYHLDKPVQMELLPVGKDYGQRNGIVLYRVESKTAAKTYEVTGKVQNHAILLADGLEQAVTEDHTGFTHTFAAHEGASSSGSGHTYDLLVQNQGRANGGGGMHNEWRGIHGGEIRLDGHPVHNITAYTLDLNQTYMRSLPADQWVKFDSQVAKGLHGPALYRFELTIAAEPVDTYLNFGGWKMGFAFVNGFNLGRFVHNGPQRTLYVPGPKLKTGPNVIDLFEVHQPGEAIVLQDHPQLS